MKCQMYSCGGLTNLGMSVASRSLLPVVIGIRPIALKQPKKILELMPKVLPVTSRLTTEQKPLPSLRKHQRWDLLV